MTPIGVALVALGVTIFVLGENKREKLEEQLNDLHEEAQAKLFEPILIRTILRRKARMNPQAYMATPEVVDDMRTLRLSIAKYAEVDSYRWQVCSSLTLSAMSLFFTGLAILALVIGTTCVSAFETTNLTLELLVIGVILFLYFLKSYKKHMDGYLSAIREIRREM